MSITTPLSFLVAPSGFKESLDADTVANAIAAGIRRVVPGARIQTVPLVDGGEGTAVALAHATGGTVVPVTVTGPVGAPVESHYALLGDGKTAVVEMAAAAGLRLVPTDRRNPTKTTTRGVGELMLAALDAGCSRILVGCGDSGTSDGGAGALQALGARLLDERGEPVREGARGLKHLDRVDMSGLDPRLAEVEIVVACNPTNVLTGSRGVARVFGPQKGASPKQVEQLSDGLRRWAEVLERDAPGADGVDLRHGPGTGASGGLGAGLAAIGATLQSRFDVLLEPLGLDEVIDGVDLVITAEGSIDKQTPNGKIPSEVARRAQRLQTPVLALAGTIGAGSRRTHDIGIDAIQCVLPAPVELAEACERGEEFVADGAERAVRTILLGVSLATAGVEEQVPELPPHPAPVLVA